MRRDRSEALPPVPAPAPVPDVLDGFGPPEARAEVEIDRLAEETRRRCPDVWAELARFGRIDTLS